MDQSKQRQSKNKNTPKRSMELTDEEAQVLELLLSVVLTGARSPVRDQLTSNEFSILGKIKRNLKEKWYVI